MRSIVMVALMMGLPVAAIVTPAAAGAQRPVVVELFTSQGCSSCPPADRLLRELAARADVLALAFHVTYWNSLGWADPYSFAGATARQRRYAPVSGIGGVYTPQAVVDGAIDVVGSDEAGLRRAIAAGGRTEVTVSAVRAGAGAVVALGAGQGSAKVWLVGYDREHVTKVGRGENAGETLVEANIVRGIVEIGTWSGAAVELRGVAPEGEALAVLVQGGDGRIIGAARVARPEG